MYAATDIKDGELIMESNGTQYLSSRSKRFEDFVDKDRIDDIISIPNLIKLDKENVVTVNLLLHMAWLIDGRNEDWLRHIINHKLTPVYSFTDEEIELLKPEAEAYKYAKTFRKQLIVKKDF